MGNPKKLDIPLEKLIAIASTINENTIANKSRSKEDKIPTDKFIRQFGINRKDFSLTIKDTEIKYNSSTFLYDIPELLQGNNSITNTDIKPSLVDKQESNYKVTTESEHQSNNKVTLLKPHLRCRINNFGSKFRLPPKQLPLTEQLPLIEEDRLEASKMLLREKDLTPNINLTTIRKVIPPSSIGGGNYLNMQTSVGVKSPSEVVNNSIADDALKNIPEELRKIMTLSSELEEVVYWYRKHKDDDRIIEIPEININHPDLEGDLSVRSFKTYTKVLDKFAEYCKGRKETQKDLLALALVEFIDKYK